MFFWEQWATLISQLPAVFTPRKLTYSAKRKSFHRDEKVVFERCSSPLYLAIVEIKIFREIWGKKLHSSHMHQKVLSAPDSCSTRSAVQVTFLWILALNSTRHLFPQPPPDPYLDSTFDQNSLCFGSGLFLTHGIVPRLMQFFSFFYHSIIMCDYSIISPDQSGNLGNMANQELEKC